MENLVNLTDLTPQEWDAHITRELEAAKINIVKFREYDSPHSWVKHTLKGELEYGLCTFSRTARVWLLWCRLPLASAEVIHLDPVCQLGMRRGSGVDKPIGELDPLTYPIMKHEWIDEQGHFILQDDGTMTERWKTIVLEDSPSESRFATDPSAEGGRPYVTGYNFFTLAALVRFSEIVRRHKVA